jgi:rRNA maturation RNase YbeY
LSRIEVILSETASADLLPAETRRLCESAVRETLLLEARRLGELPAASARGGEPEAIEVSLTLMDNAGIRELNRRYLERDSATDVLAFSMGGEDPGEAEPFLLGDVVVSVETIRTQATEWERPFEEELARVVSHGVLHLLGYTDESGEAAAAMHTKEDAVLTVLGFRPRLP